MKKSMYLRRISTKRSYSSEELAERLGICRATVRRWKQLGLTPLPNHKAPYLYLGSEIKRFISNQLFKTKIKLEKDEFYCLVCKKAVRPNQIETEVVNRNKKIGKDLQAVFFINHCPNCKTKLIRFGSLPINYQKPVARTPPTKPYISYSEDQQRLF